MMITNALAIIETEEQRNSLAEFYKENKNGLYAFALSRTHNREKAEDAVQETFLRIAKYPDVFFALPNGKRKSYAVIVTRNAVADILNESAKSEELPDTLASETSVENLALGSIAADELKEFIGKMPEAQRDALILKTVHGLSYSEIAAELNITDSTARKRVSNAYKTIKAYLNGGI